MSNDPSPWGEITEPEVTETTQELIVIHLQESASRAKAEMESEVLWGRYAARMTAAGTLIR